jgi:hypothetical protein
MSCCKKVASCPTKRAHARVIVDIADGSTKTDPVLTVSLDDCVGSCGIKDVQFSKIFSTLVVDECVALKIKLVYDDCFFAKGLPPLVFTSTCAPNEHTYDAEVRNICDISNGQCAYFRVGIRGDAGQTCYPQCTSAADLPAGQVAFNIEAVQGDECKH